MTVSVQIPTWKRKILLVELVKSLAFQSIPRSDYEILICDSYGNDGSEREVLKLSQDFKDLQIKYFQITQNTLSAKRNFLFNSTSKDIVITVDDDIKVNKDFLKGHIDTHRHLLSYDKNSKNIVCGQVVFPKEWVRKSNYYKYRDRKHKLKTKHLSKLDRNNIIVMNMSLIKESYNLDYFMNEKFVKYGGEDQEFEHRCLMHGYKFYYNVNSRAEHFELSSLTDYLRKIYFSSRFGDKTLVNEIPNYNYAGKISILKNISNGVHKNVLHFLYSRLLTSDFIKNMIVLFLEKTDSNPFFYTKKAFDIIVANAILAGLSDQDKPSKDQSWI